MGAIRSQREWIVLVVVASLMVGCGFNGASVTARPDLARNATPNDVDEESPVVGTPEAPVVVLPPPPPIAIPAPRPLPKDPEAIFENRPVGEYVVEGRLFEISPTGQSKRRVAATLDVKIHEAVQVNKTLRQYEDQTGYLTGFATVRHSSRAGFPLVRFGVRLQEDSHGRKTLYFSEASARRLMRALLPKEMEKGEVDLRSEGGLVLAKFGALSIAGEGAVIAGSAAICNPSRAGAIRMLNRELLWRSWSTPNLLQHPECR